MATTSRIGDGKYQSTKITPDIIYDDWHSFIQAATDDDLDYIINLLEVGLNELIEEYNQSAVYTEDADIDEGFETINAGYYSIKFSPAVICSGEVPGFDINFIEGSTNLNSRYSGKESTATKLQGVVSKTFRGLQIFAIVGLLSVLVYIAIRIIIGSVGEKSKYKQMLMDWLVAMCILFTLLFIMLFILNITQSITKVLSVSTISEDGEDILMTDLRNEIKGDTSFESVFVQTVIYVALVFYTCSYTIKYLKRVVYMAFLTMIAPLIALTYPLDKIKDSKAQAFGMWLKEYIFNAMIQPVDLLLYYILLGSSLSLINNPIYALVAIGFLTPAEKFFRKMFGMESKTPVGQLGAAAAGATTMNLINSMKKGGKGGAKGGTHEEKTPKGVRTATTPALAALQSNSSANVTQQTEEGDAESINNFGDSAMENQTASMLENSTSQAQGSSSNSTSGRTINQSVSPATPARTANRSNLRIPSNSGTITQTGSQKSNSPKRIAGVANVAKVLRGKAVKSGIRIAGKTAGGVAFGTIGIAAGVTSGNLNTVFQNAVAGGAIGSAVGGRLAGTAVDATKNIEKTFHSVQDTYREGAYDRETAQNMKFDREFFNSSEGKELLKQYTQEEVKRCLEAGITEKKKMEKILKVSKKISKEKPAERDAIGKAIAYSHLADKCKDDILISDSKFIRYLETNQISTANASEIRAGISEFKK